MSTLDPAEYLEQLAAEVGDIRDRLDAAGTAALEALLTPQDVTARVSSSSIPSATTGTGEVAPASVIAPGAVTSTEIADGAVTAPKITANAVDMTKFAQAIIPPRLAITLPALPDDLWPVGSSVFVTSTKTLHKNEAGAWVDADEADLSTSRLYAGSIAAGAIGAREMAAEIVLASLIKTANTGARVEIDRDGVRSIASDSTLLVDIPTNGDPVYIAARVLASALTVSGNAELRGTGNSFAKGSATTLEVGVSNPGAVPTLAAFVAAKSLATAATKGLHYDSAGGAGGATAVFWTLGSDGKVYELLASDGSVNRSVAFTATPSLLQYIAGVAPYGSHIFVLYKLGGAWYVNKRLKSDLSSVASYSFGISWPIATPRYPVIASDGTYLYVADVAATTGYLSWNTYDDTMAKMGTTVATGVAPGGATFQPGGLYVGNGDFGALRLVIAGVNGTAYAFVFNSTGTRQTNDEWERAGSGDDQGLGFDGTYFYCLRAGSGVAAKFGPWNWSAAGNATKTIWSGYTWYDPNATGGTHETAISPRKSVPIKKRRTLSITTPPVPTGSGGTDDATQRRVYLYDGVSDPGSTGLKLQSSSDYETTYLDSYNGSGAADPAANNFPGGTPARIASSGTGWALKGDGSINRTGTSFPASPETDDHFTRSDLGLEFRYDGTRWLSTQVFRCDLREMNSTGDLPLTATRLSIHRAVWPDPLGGSDIWLERYRHAFYVSGGSALGASHKWVGTISGDGGSTFATLDVSSGASDTWRSGAADIDALGGSYNMMWVTWTKTGTPGNLYTFLSIYYRVVAT